MWKRLIHPNIVPFIGVTIDPPQIASGWMPGGNLTAYINSHPNSDRVSLVSISSCLPDTSPQLPSAGRRRKGPRLPPLSRRDSWRSEGGECLQILVNDLPQDPRQPNILIDVCGHARITDFGLAQDTLDIAVMPEGRSLRWTAPEVLAETGTPSTEADVFSFGMVMVEVCSNSMTTRPPKLRFWYKAFTGTVPFSNHISSAAMMAIMRGERPPRPTHLSLTDRLGELMNHCLNQDRHDRPRMLEVLLTLNPLIYGCAHPIGTLPVIADVQTLVSDIQQRLKNLNPSHEEYRPLLYALLSHQDLKPYIGSLRRVDLQQFIELLDEVKKADTHHN